MLVYHRILHIKHDLSVPLTSVNSVGEGMDNDGPAPALT
jgi:hypothetical protein